MQKYRPDIIALLRKTYTTAIKPYAPGITLAGWLAMSPADRHRIYLRAYYRVNAEAAKEYQRLYNRKNSSTRKIRDTYPKRERERTHIEIHRYNITSLSTPHFEKLLEDILSGKCELW